MKTLNTFLTDIIDNKSLKVIPSIDAMIELRDTQDTCLVHSFVLYRLYELYLDRKPSETRPEFFKIVGGYLYFEKFPCQHGDEYYYYVCFNKNSSFYLHYQDLITALILANDPDRLTDYIGTQRQIEYNKHLKLITRKRSKERYG